MNRRDIDAAVFGSDSEEEAIATLVATGVLGKQQRTGRDGSSSGKRANLPRDFDLGLSNILRDYLGNSPVYTEHEFELRFRMPRSVFDKICGELIGESVFVRKEDALGKTGIYPIQRITAALRMLAYGFGADAVDEYCRLSKTEALTSLKEFSKTLLKSLARSI
jgi:hypothetical protein